MFKKLKQKIGEGVANSPAASSITKLTQGKVREEPSHVSPNQSQSSAFPVYTNDETDPETAILVNLQEENGQSLEASGLSSDFHTAHSSSELSLSTSGPAELPVSSTSEHLTRSRTSSVSSEVSDASLFSPLSLPQRQYMLPSDVESASEFEDSASASGGYATPTSVSKEELYQRYLKMQRRSEKFKVKLMQVINAYKELDKEKDKLKTTLTQSQDKAFRRISELKEQIELDKLAKQHIEDNYQLMLEEKEELTKVLQTQISLLKEGKQVPEELLVKISEAEDKVSECQINNSTPSGTPSKAAGDRAVSDEGNALLREKVKRLETLLNKCKETIKNNKERTQQLTVEKENILKQLETKEQEIGHLKHQYKEGTLKMQSQLNDSRKLIEELETDKTMAIASAKQQMHETIEGKDQEISKVRELYMSVKTDHEQLKEKFDVLELKAHNQLEKSRGIIKNLQEEKKTLVEEKNKFEEEMKEKIVSSEQSIEADKEEMIQQLRRGKTQALALMQQQMEAQMAELEKEKSAALEEKESEWKKKLANEMQLVEQHKQQELKRILSEKEEDMKLAIEERELQKMAALSQQDSASDHLKEKLQDYHTKCKELETKLNNLHEKQKQTVQEYTQQIESNAIRHKESMEDMSNKQQRQLDECNEKHQRLLQERIEEVSQGYKQRIDELSQQYEESSRITSAETEAAYQSQISDLKASQEKVTLEQISQIDQFKKQISEMQKQYDVVQTSLATHVGQVKDLENSLATEREEHVKLRTQMENLICKHKDEVALHQKKQNELAGQLSAIKEDLAHVTEENKKLDNESKTKECSLQEKIDTVERECAKYMSECELKEKEIEQKTQQYAESLKMERENHEKEMSRKLEEVHLHQQVSASEVSEGLGKKLSSANEQISSLEKKIQELVVRETELNNQLENVKTEHTNQAHDLEKQLANTKKDYENRLSSANDKIHSLEGTINDLIQKENQLNAELDEVRVDYETRMTMQSQEVVSLRGMVDHLKESEATLRQQLENTQKECDKLLAEAMDENIKGVTTLTESLESNQAELNKVIEELECTKSQCENFGNLQEELDYKTERLAQYEQKLIQLEEEVLRIPDMENKIATAQADLVEMTAQIKTLEANVKEKETLLHEKDACLERTNQTVQELQQNLAVWQTAAREKEGSATELLRSVDEKETQYLQLKEQMQEKISCLEGSLTEKETLLFNLKQQCDEQGRLVAELQTSKQHIEEKNQELQNSLLEADKKFQQLREEAKTKIKDYKLKLEEAQSAISELEQRLKSREEEIEKQIADMKMGFELDMSDKQLDYQAEVKVLSERLDKERASMNSFKENVKKQFDERQRQVKETIKNLKEGFDETRKDDADICNKKLQRLEKEKDKERADEVKNLKVKIENLQTEYEEATSSTKSQYDEEVNALKAEVESAKTRLKELNAQYNAEKEALQKHAIADKEEIGEHITQLQQQNNELRQQLDALKDSFGEEESKVKRTAELEGLVLSLREEIGELKDKHESSSNKFTDIIEKYKLEILEKDDSLRQQKEKIESYENTMESIHKDYQSQLEQIKEDHKADIAAKSRELGGNAQKLEEHSQILGEKEGQIMELQEKFVQLKQKAQSKCQELIKDIERKNAELLQLRDTYTSEVSDLKNEHKRSLEDAAKIHEEEKTVLENRIMELTDSDTELQGKLKELTERLNSTEVKLVEFTAHSHKTVEDFHSQLVSQKEAYEAELLSLKNKCESYEQEMNQNAAVITQDKIREYEEMVGERDKSLAISEQKCVDYERKIAQMEEGHVNNEALIKLESELKDLNNKYDRLMEEYNSSQCSLEGIQSSHAELQSDVVKLETALKESTNSKEELHMRCEELETREKQIQAEIELLRKRNEESDTLKKQEMEQLETKLLEESNTKLSELKKKAELRLTQIKKQIKGDKETVIAELSETNAKLQDQVSEMESRLNSVNLAMVEANEKVEKQEIGQKALEDEIKELLQKHQQEIEKHVSEYASVLESKESVLQEKIQRSDSQQQTEVKLKVLATNLKKENLELKESTKKLTKENLELKQKIENLNGEVQQQIHDRDVDVKSLKLEQDQELEKLKSEYEGRLEELETSHNSKIKQLVKELNLKVAEKEREFQDTFSEALDKSNRDEDKISFEHREEIAELHKDLHEKDQAIEQMLEDHQVEVQAMEEEHKADIASLNQQIEELLQKMLEKDAEIDAERRKLEEEITARISKKVASREKLHKEEIDGLSREWHLERKNLPDSLASPETNKSLVEHNQLTLQAIRSDSSNGELLRQQVIELTQQVEQLKMQHSMEVIELQNQMEMSGGGLHKPLVPVGEQSGEQQTGATDQRTELHMMNLQAQVIQQSGENAKLKIRERELSSELESHKARLMALERGETPPTSPFRSHSNSTAVTLPSEPTELEYLRNILFQYMMGKETRTLSRVICTVMKFSADEARKVLDREENKTAGWLSSP